MLDFADFVAINKFDRRRAGRAARRASRCSATRRRGASPDQMPVFGTMASRFADDGVTALSAMVRAGAGGEVAGRFETAGG